MQLAWTCSEITKFLCSFRVYFETKICGHCNTATENSSLNVIHVLHIYIFDSILKVLML